MKFYAVLLALLAMGPMVRGGCPTSFYRTYSPTTYSSTSYVSHAKSYDYALQFVVPTVAIYSAPAAYGALYYPPAAFYGQGAGTGADHTARTGAGADPCAETKKQLTDLQQRFSRLEGFLEGRGAIAPQRVPTTGQQPMDRADDRGGNGSGEVPRQPVRPKLELLTQNCAGCHAATNAQALGKGFVMFGADGGLARLDPLKIGEVLRRTALPDGHAEAMPRGKAVGAAVKLAVINEYIAAQQ